MKNKNIILIIVVVVLIATLVLGAIVLLKENNGTINLDQYKGYWYDEKEPSKDAPIVDSLDELNIKKVENNTITFDYKIAMLCGEKDIKVEIKDSKGEFKTEESKGTIKLSQDKIEFTVKNSYYDETFERTFTYKNSDSRFLQKYVGKWCDEGEFDYLTINSIENNEISFNLDIFRIVGFENLTATYNPDSRVAEFNTNNTDMGDFWKGVYGNITLGDHEITLEITKSDCEYISPTTYVFDIGR